MLPNNSPENIPISVLRKLPAGSFIGLKEIKDMYGRPCTAIIWFFYEKFSCSHRTSYFDLETGDYLGEYIFRR